MLKEKQLNFFSQKFALFRTASAGQIKAIEFQKHLLSTFLVLKDFPQLQLFAILTPRYLALQFPQKVVEEQGISMLVADINFGLKFDSISKDSIHTGFKLVGEASNKEIFKQMIFLCPNSFLAMKWVDTLRSVLNECNFHSKFKAIRKLGKGNFASVYEVERIEDSKRFAVKAFSKVSLRQSQQGLKALQTQIAILRTIDHENTLKMQAVYESQNSIYAVMELLKDGNLLNFLKQRNFEIQSSQTQTIISGLLKGLVHLHQKRIIHRDLKLENIMIKQSGNLTPVIVDFGLSIFSDADSYLYYRCGTPGYIPPEILALNSNSQHIQPQSDIFSLGVVFHILLTGRALFEGKSMEQIYHKNKEFKINLNESLPDMMDSSIVQLLAAMLELDPTKRPKAEECLNYPYFVEIDEKYSPGTPATITTDNDEENLMEIQF